MTPEFYRGGTRSPFSSMVNTGPFSTGGGNVAAIPVAAAVAGSQLRLKRIQVTLLIPKTAATIIHGWYAFVRVPDDFSAQYADLTPAEPTVLRPKAFVSNEDHATYWENYLEAINIDGGGVVHVLVHASGPISSGLDAHFAIRWTEERQLG